MAVSHSNSAISDLLLEADGEGLEHHKQQCQDLEELFQVNALPSALQDLAEPDEFPPSESNSRRLRARLVEPPVLDDGTGNCRGGSDSAETPAVEVEMNCAAAGYIEEEDEADEDKWDDHGFQVADAPQIQVTPPPPPSRARADC